MTHNDMGEINITNRTYYYLNHISDIHDLDFENVILNKVLYEDLFIYYIRYKITYKLKILSINFVK